MRALAKLVATNNPDKIIFVGEALVGNEAVDQLTKFDRALRDFSASGIGAGQGRGIDGMLVTKWDTVDDKVSFRIITVRDRIANVLRRFKVGAALSMTYVTGQPIMFVGCGQVSQSPHLRSPCVLNHLHVDVHGFATAPSFSCCPSSAERLVFQSSLMSRFYMLLYYSCLSESPRGRNPTKIRTRVDLAQHHDLNSTNLSVPSKETQRMSIYSQTNPYHAHTPAQVSRSGTYRPPPGAPPPQATGGHTTFANPAAYGAPPGADPQLWQWFKAVDEDRSGSISCQELQRALVNGNWAREYYALINHRQQRSDLLFTFAAFDLDTVKLLMALFVGSAQAPCAGIPHLTSTWSSGYGPQWDHHI